MVKKKKEKKRGSSFGGKTGANARRQQQEGSQYAYLQLSKGISVFKPEPGKRVMFDILPYLVSEANHPDRDDELGIAIAGEYWYKRPFKIHRNVGTENDAIVCPSSIGKSCPICKYRKRRFTEDAEKEETDALKVSKRNLYVAIPIDHKDYKQEPHIFDISQFNFQELLNEELAEDEQNETFPDLEEGLTLRVRFDSKTIGKSKPFAQANRIDFKEREEAYDEEILEDIPDLDSMLIILDYKELEAKFLELDDEDMAKDEDEIEESEEEDEEEDSEEDEEDDENVCKACEGSGENSKGGNCVPCDGTGEKKKAKKSRKKKDKKEESDDDDDKKSKKKGKGKKDKKKNRCPHGHKFGVDTDDEEHEDDCNNCPDWGECDEEKEKE